MRVVAFAGAKALVKASSGFIQSKQESQTGFIFTFTHMFKESH
jgi:hypothetical protein